MLDVIKNSQIQTKESQVAMAPTADEFYKKNMEKKREDELIQLLSFIVDNEEYALKLSETMEVIKMRDVTEVPHAPSFISGIISLRGEIIPVISMQKRLGLKEKDIDLNENRMIVASHSDIKIGLIVDRIMGVVKVNQNNIESTSNIQQDAGGEFIRGVVHHKDRLIILLNLPMLLEMEDV